VFLTVISVNLKLQILKNLNTLKKIGLKQIEFRKEMVYIRLYVNTETSICSCNCFRRFNVFHDHCEGILH